MASEEAEILLSTAMLPPMPQYVIAAGGLAVAVIVCCLHLAERFADSRVVMCLQRTGQVSLTLYVAHVMVGMGVLGAFGRLENQTIGFALLSAGAFCALGVMFGVLWLQRFRAGPLEWVFRKIAS